MSKGITSDVTFHDIEGCRVYCLPTRSEGVVSIAGSFRTPTRSGLFDDVLRDLLVGMLDKGTASQDRFEISERLDRAGAEREFIPIDNRIMFRGRSVSESVGVLFDVVFDELVSPRLAAEQLDALKSRYDYAVLRSTESTGAMASEQLSRMIYEPEHPNYEFLPTVRRSAYADTTASDILEYHHCLNVRDDLTIVVVGKFDKKKMLADLKQSLLGISAGPTLDKAPILLTGFREDFADGLRIHPMRDKQNLDVAFGIPMEILRTSGDYLPLYVGNFVLGGNFSSRLMQIIRDEMGLTYGIRSLLGGISTTHSGHWQLGVTLSGEALEKGIDAIRRVFEDFCNNGATTDEVAQKKTTIRGNYSTRVSTTGALAGSILRGVEMGFGPHYPDIYRDEIDAVTIGEVNDAVGRFLRGRSIATSVAGTIAEDQAETLLTNSVALRP